jgi:hypothetical protein
VVGSFFQQFKIKLNYYFKYKNNIIAKMKTQTKTLNAADYRQTDTTTYQIKTPAYTEDKWDRYTTDEGLPYFINRSFDKKWRYIDEEGIEYYVLFKK